MPKTKFYNTLSAGLYGLLPALCCLVRGLSDRLYTDIDSFLISMTCAGLYGQDTICPDIHPLLGIAVGQLTRLFPGPDWFALLSRTGTVLAVWWLGILLAHCLSSRTVRWTCLLVFSFALLQESLLNVNFTITCGLFFFVGAVTLLLGWRHFLPRWSRWIAAAFFCLAVLWRTAGAALVLPFVVLDLCVLAVSRRCSPRTLLSIALPSLLAVGMLVLFSAGFYNLSPVRENANAYNAARGALVDYPHKEWATISGELTDLGLSENDYHALVSGLLLDTRIVTADLLQKVAAVAQAPAYPLSVQSILSILSTLPGLFSTPLLRILTVLALFLLLATLLGRTTLPEKLEILLALGGGLLICVYYSLAGRLPERVIACVLLAFSAIVLSLFLCLPVRSNKGIDWFRRLLCIIAGFAFCLCLWQNRYQYKLIQPAWQAAQPATREEDAMLPGEPDAVYLWQPMTLALYLTDHYMEEGKLPGKAFVQQNLAWGEWNTSGQPCLEQLLAQLQMANPMESLLTRPHTYLVATDASLVETWLREHYDPHTVLMQVGTVEVFAAGEVPVWQVSAG